MPTPTARECCRTWDVKRVCCCAALVACLPATKTCFANHSVIYNRHRVCCYASGAGPPLQQLRPLRNRAIVASFAACTTCVKHVRYKRKYASRNPLCSSQQALRFVHTQDACRHKGAFPNCIYTNTYGFPCRSPPPAASATPVPSSDSANYQASAVQQLSAYS